jgi:hypothetical protein
MAIIKEGNVINARFVRRLSMILQGQQYQELKRQMSFNNILILL